MAQPQKQRDALQVIFAFFLGLMVTAFIGMGVYTFHSPPRDDLDGPDQRTEELRREQRDLRDGRADSELSVAQRERIDTIDAELREFDRQRRLEQESWSRTTSIVLVLLSTLVMGISLVRADQLPVISNGLLLGGVFTMLYGTGWTLASGESQLRFWVMAFALVVTLGLGYLRFVRTQRARAEAGADPAMADADVARLQSRLEDLERRMDAAGEAFRGHGD